MNLLKRRRVIQKVEKTHHNGVKKVKQNYFEQQRHKKIGIRNETINTDSFKVAKSFLSYNNQQFS